MLKCETDTPEVKAEIKQMVNPEIIFKHGQWWVRIDFNPRSIPILFSVVDTNNGLELKQI